VDRSTLVYELYLLFTILFVVKYTLQYYQNRI